MNSFQLVGLPMETFLPLFGLADAALAERNIRRVVATAQPGFPCRVSLADAVVGEALLLLSFQHQAALSPYRSSGPIFVRQSAVQACLAPGVVPDYIGRRLLSVRAYDAAHLICDAVVCEGRDAASVLQGMFGSDEVAYIHLHNADRGCFLSAVQRA